MSERNEQNETWGEIIKQVPLWFWLALIAPVITGIVLTLLK
jgi:hypothetical protein